jgi:hypothetical protein
MLYCAARSFTYHTQLIRSHFAQVIQWRFYSKSASAESNSLQLNVEEREYVIHSVDFEFSLSVKRPLGAEVALPVFLHTTHGGINLREWHMESPRNWQPLHWHQFDYR